MFTVSLQGIQIRATVGLYAEECILGNKLCIDVSVSNIPNGEDAFLDYSIIYQMVTESFNIPKPMLEHHVLDIHARLRSMIPAPAIIRVGVSKLRPPLGGEVDRATVVYEA
jgi:dihydroneopterin aldolase